MSSIHFDVDLSGSTFEVEETDDYGEYEVHDSDGAVVFRVHQQRGEYTFEDAHGNPVFRVTNSPNRDVANSTNPSATGDYAIVDETTEEPVVSLTHSSKPLHEHWDAEAVDSGDEVVQAGRVNVPSWLDWLIDINPDYLFGESDGNVPGSITLRAHDSRTATIEVYDAKADKKSATVATALAISVLEDD